MPVPSLIDTVGSTVPICKVPASYQFTVSCFEKYGTLPSVVVIHGMESYSLSILDNVFLQAPVPVCSGLENPDPY
jgi:hypothetical protein